MRRGEHKRLAAQGDERLSGTRYAWLYHPDQLMARSPDPARGEAFEALALSNLQTAEEEEGTSGGWWTGEPRAYYHRILFLEFWEAADIPSAQRFFTQWYHQARRSRLEPIKKAAETLKNHLHGLLRAHPESPFQAILWRGDLLGCLLEWASSDLRPT